MIKKIDHLVITTADMKNTIEFYEKLGFRSEDKGTRFELYAEDFKINVHFLGKELLPHAKNVKVGSGDFCFEITEDINDYIKKIKENDLKIDVDLVERHGRFGIMKSIYLYDPNGNLVEISSYK